MAWYPMSLATGCNSTLFSGEHRKQTFTSWTRTAVAESLTALHWLKSSNNTRKANAVLNVPVRGKWYSLNEQNDCSR